MVEEVYNQLNETFVRTSVCPKLGALGIGNRVGFLTQKKMRKKDSNWSTSCSIEGLSFFLFTPRLQRNLGGGRKKYKERKTFQLKNDKENLK